MSSLETAAFVLTIYPIAVKVTDLLIKAFDGLQRDLDYQDKFQRDLDYEDKLLALKLERHKFNTWVQNRKFTTQRVLETRLRKEGENGNRDGIMNEFALAYGLISRILTTITEHWDLHDKNTRPKRSDTTSRSRGCGPHQHTLNKYLKEALARLPDGPSKDKLAASLRSPQTLEVSKGWRIMDAVKPVILDRDSKFNQLIHNVKEWNSYLTPLLEELIGILLP